MTSYLPDCDVMFTLDFHASIEPPPSSVLTNLGARLSGALLLFRGDGRVAFASPGARAFFADASSCADLSAALFVDKQTLALVRAKGQWSGSFPLCDKLVIAHIAYALEKGVDWYLAQIHQLDGQQDYDKELLQRHEELQQAYLRLNNTEDKLLQSEKMASIGQLAAGVAHEINNPIGYVHSNLGSLQEYLRSLFTMVETYERTLNAADPKAMLHEVEDVRQRLDIDFIVRDLPQLLAESREGIERVTRIVRDLKDFSYSGRGDSWRRVDIHAGLESTINIIWNELKYKVALERHYSDLPLVECLPSELNQVWMNLLLNAGHAIAERGRIDVSTGSEGEWVWVEIADSGEGIAPDVLKRIFDPFFTTKPVGSGTGLGLSIVYSIVNKHHGRIDVTSPPGSGARFKVWLPVAQTRRDDGQS